MSDKPLKEVRDFQASQKKKAWSDKTADLRYCFNGLELLVESGALATTSIYAIYSAQHNHMPHAGAVVLTVAGAVIALRAFVEFVKLLNRRG